MLGHGYLRLLSVLLLGGSASAQQLTLSDAIRGTLRQHPRLKVEDEQVQIARAATRIAAGSFDTQIQTGLRQDRTNSPLTGLQRLQVRLAGFEVGNQSTNYTIGEGSVSRLFRNGSQLSASLNLTRTTDNTVLKQGVNLSQMRIQATLPFLQGRGRAIVTAEETSSALDADAAVLDLNHTAASLLADTVTRYWEAVAARQGLEVAQQAEERGRVFLHHVRTLIEADRLPRAELQQVLANVAGRAANRAAAEQRLIEARQALSLATGARLEDLRHDINPSDDFPEPETAAIHLSDRTTVDRMVNRSLSCRADYLSLRKTQGAFDLRRQAAADRLKPKLDLQFSTGYSGLNEGRRPERQISSLFTRIGGVDVSAGFEYTLPVHRSAARGRLEQAVALARKNEYSTADLARSITSEILSGVGVFQSAIARVEHARLTVDASQAALDGEREKLRLGVGSVVDLLTIEDRLTNARAGYVDARLNYALLIARMRFATGTILAPDRPAQSVRPAIFYRPPWEDPEE